jgi:hypothetical protein
VSSPITYRVRVDWNQNGVFTDANEDITRYVLMRARVVLDYGRDTARIGSPTMAGTAEFGADNADRRFSPLNTGSPLAGLIGPNREVLIEATHLGTTYTLYRGFLDEDMDVLPEYEERATHFSCLDAIGRMTKVKKLSTALHQGIRTGDAVNKVLDAIGWPSGKRDIDAGATYIRFWWEEDTTGPEAIEKIVNSEGPPAFVFAGPDGYFTFRDRHHRLTRAASTTSQKTFRASGAEPLFVRPTVFQAGWRDIINTVDLTVDERGPETAESAVFESERTFSLNASEVRDVEAKANDPFMSAVVPVEGTDYTLRSGSVTVTLSRTSGQSTVITLTAGGSGCRITDLQLRAVSVPVKRSLKYTKTDAASLAEFDVRDYALDAPWASQEDAEAIASVILLHRARPLPRMTFRLNGTNDTRITQQFARDLSDRIHITEPEAGVDHDYYLEHIHHDLDQKPATDFRCDQVPPNQPASGFILGTDLLNTGVLGF